MLADVHNAQVEASSNTAKSLQVSKDFYLADRYTPRYFSSCLDGSLSCFQLPPSARVLCRCLTTMCSRQPVHVARPAASLHQRAHFPNSVPSSRHLPCTAASVRCSAVPGHGPPTCGHCQHLSGDSQWSFLISDSFTFHRSAVNLKSPHPDHVGFSHWLKSMQSWLASNRFITVALIGIFWVIGAWLAMSRWMNLRSLRKRIHVRSKFKGWAHLYKLCSKCVPSVAQVNSIQRI